MPKSNRISPAQLKAMTGKAERKHSEHEMQVALFKLIALGSIRLPHWKTIYAVPNLGTASPLRGQRMKAEGRRAGIPDICCPFARGGYHALYIEMKVKGNYPSQAQKDMIELLRANGNRVEVCYSSEEAFKILKEYEHS